MWAATSGDAWYSGQARGVLGVLHPDSGEVEEIPLGDGSRPHGVIECPDGAAWITDGGLNAIVEVDVGTGEVTTYPLPDSHPDANLNTATFDAQGTLWFTGQMAVYDPVDGSWQEWPLPGDMAQAYAVFVDDRDIVWLSDFAANTVVSFDPATEAFESFPLPGDPGEVRQIHGRPGEVWLPESAADQLVVFRTG